MRLPENLHDLTRVLPFRPLEEAVERRGGFRIVFRKACMRHGWMEPGESMRAALQRNGPARDMYRVWMRERRAGRVTERMADRLAIKLLATPPLSVWGEDYYQVVSALVERDEEAGRVPTGDDEAEEVAA